LGGRRTRQKKRNAYMTGFIKCEVLISHTDKDVSPFYMLRNLVQRLVSPIIIPIIPATPEAEVEGSDFKSILGKSGRPYLRS
jgi:hypothetical protein